MLRQLYQRLAELLALRPPRWIADRRAAGQRLATPIGQARDRRLVRLCGQAQPDLESVKPLLISPLGQRACLYYRLQVQVLREGRWQTVIDEAKLAVRLFLEDESGRALVEGGERAFVGDEILAQAPAFDGRPSPQIATLLRRRGAYDPLTSLTSLTSPTAPRRYRYREFCLEAGSELWALGLCRHEPDPDPRSAGTYRHRALRVRLLAPWFGLLRVGVAVGGERLGASGKLC